MTNVRMFRRANGISQKELADYLGVTQGAVSQWELGATNISNDMLSKMVENDRGWDTSMLGYADNSINTNMCGDGNVANINASSILHFQKVIESLTKQLEEERERNKRLMDVVEKLTDKIVK